MNTSRNAWTESNRQLWTSSQDAGQRASRSTSMLDDSSTSVSSMPSAIESTDPDDTLAVVMKECQESGGGLLSSRAESSLASLLSTANAEGCTKSLVSILLATNARRRREAHDAAKVTAEASGFRSTLKSVVGQITMQVRGETLEADEAIDDSLYRVLLDVEKCTELAQVATGVAKPCLRDTLLEACGPSQRAKLSTMSTEGGRCVDSSSAALPDTMEMLESHGYVTSSEEDIAESVLCVIKDVEKFKRESSFQSVLLHQYERTVRARLAVHGDTEPPLVEAEKARLLMGAAVATEGMSTDCETKPWWAKRVQRMCEHLSRIPATTTVEALPQAGPLNFSTDAEASQRSITDFLDVVDTSVIALFRECTRSRSVVEDLANRLRAAALLPREGRDDARGERQIPVSAYIESVSADLAAALKLGGPKVGGGERKKIRSPSEEAAVKTEDVAEDGECVIPPTKLLGLVVDCLPTAVRAKFELGRTGIFDERRAAQLLGAVAFLDEHNRDTIHRIDDLCGRLRETFQMIDSTQDRTLAEQLSFLEDAVSAVCRRSVEAVSSESSLTREVRQSIEELAQLLVISPQPHLDLTGEGSNAALSGIRVAPPTDDILVMTRILKSRIIDWQQAQAKRNSAGGHYRAEKMRLEESIRSFTASAQTLLAELIAGPTIAPCDAGGGLGGESEEGSSVSGDAAAVQQVVAAMATSSDVTLSDVLERLKLVKTRYMRAVQANELLRSRAESATSQSKATQRSMKRVAEVVTTICETLGVTPGALKDADGTTDNKQKKKKHAEADTSRDNVGAYGKLNLRPGARSPSDAHLNASKLSEENVVEALRLVATRVSADDALVKKSMSEGELERLRAVEKRAASDTSAFRQAIAMILTRMAENGQMVKQALYLLGTDESPKDEVVESVLCASKDKKDSRKEGKKGGSADTMTTSALDGDDDSEQHEANERQLATLLQKYSRWSRRLIETTEDHLDTQQKLVKYFAAVRRYFASLQEQMDASSEGESTAAAAAAAAANDAIMDENLIDIDTTLMRFADVILPTLDLALRRGVKVPTTASSSTNHYGGDASPASRAAQGEGETMAHPGGPTSEGLPYDHRLGRLYEMINRLHTIMTALLRVRYLSVPTGSRQRSSGEAELLFDAEDSIGNGFVDLDLDKLVRVSVAALREGAGEEPERFSREKKVPCGSGGSSSLDKSKSPSTPPPLGSAGAGFPVERVVANNDLIYRVATQNLDCVYQAIRKFSSSHKMAAILIQKDTDAVQERVAAMLEKYSELDIEQAFGQDRGELRDMYAVLKERGTRQKGCYFFNRVNGEGDCVWVRALESLGSGFSAIIDKLVDRTTAVARTRELINEVVDVCAMYVNWTETTTLPEGYALSDDIKANCVRDDEEPRTDEGRGTPSRREGGRPKLPPLPASTVGGVAFPTPAASLRTPASVESGGDATKTWPKVSHFRRDDVVVKVIASMFRLAQEGADGAGKEEALQQQLNQLEEETQLLKETVTVAEQRNAQLEQERAAIEAEKNKAFSEAAVAKVELRRWKKLVEAKRVEIEGGEAPRRITDNTPTRSSGGNADATAATSTTGTSAGVAVAGSEGVLSQGLQDQSPDCLQEMLQYMKALSEELHYANRVASGRSAGRRSVNDDDDDDIDDDEGVAELERQEWAAARERAARARAAQRQLQEQYGGTPLRVVVETDRRGYADALSAASSHRRASTAAAPSTPSRRPPRDRFFSDKTPMSSSSRGGGGAYREPRLAAGPSPLGRAATPRRTPASYPKPPQRATPVPEGRRTAPTTPSEDLYFDADPLLPPSVQRGGVDARPRKRYASPQSQGELTGALRTIQTEEARVPLESALPGRQRSGSANANMRAAALRRLADVVSKTKVRGPNGEMF